MRRHCTCDPILIFVAVCAVFSAQAQITARINTDRVSVRAKASIFSEVVGQLRQGDHVTVLEVIKQQQPRLGEPTEWVKIKMPTNALVWVNAAHIDSTKKTVVATRLNVRAGPGLNYSIVGSLNKGDAIRPVRVLDDWVEIEAPPDCWAFVNGLYLAWGKTERVQGLKGSVEAAGPAAREVAEVKSVHAETNREPPEAKRTQYVAAVSTGPRAAGNTGEVRRSESVTTNVVQRNDVAVKQRPVRREGILVRSTAPRVPSPYRLRSVDTGRIVGFVRFSSELGDVGSYVGQRVVLEGIESREQSMPTIPVIFATGIALVEQ